MRSENGWARVLLAVAIAGISFGSVFFSGGMCGGGSGGGHYMAAPGVAAK